MSWNQPVFDYFRFYGLRPSSACSVFCSLGKSIRNFVLAYGIFLDKFFIYTRKKGFLWSTWQVNDVSPVTLNYTGSAVNISSTWASLWNTLARLSYGTLCLSFSQLWLASTTDSLARGWISQSKRPLPCLLYCTIPGTAQHGWPCCTVAFSLTENAAVLWKRRTRLAQVLPST